MMYKHTEAVCDPSQAQELHENSDTDLQSINCPVRALLGVKGKAVTLRVITLKIVPWHTRETRRKKRAEWHRKGPNGWTVGKGGGGRERERAIDL